MKIAGITACCLFALLTACGGGDPICDSAELTSALAEASPGDTVRIGNCRVVASVTVPAGVRLEGFGQTASSLMSSGGSAAVTLVPGASASQLANLTVESAGPIGVLARGSGHVALTDVDVRVSLGVGVGLEDLASAVLTNVRITGTVVAGNASSIPLAATATIAATYGLAMKNVAAAMFTDVSARGFSQFGAAILGSAIGWNGGGAPDNRQAGLFVRGGMIDMTGLELSRTFNSMFNVRQAFGGIFAGGAVVTSNALQVAGVDGLGVLHVDAPATHNSVNISGNAEDGVRVEMTDDFEITGVISENHIGGVVALDSTDVLIHDATIEGTVEISTVLAQPPFPTIRLGDGVHLVNTTAGVELRDLTLTNNERVGVLIELAGATLDPAIVGAIDVSSTGDQLGVVAQGGTVPQGWDANVNRQGAAAANDAAFTGVLDHLAVTGPCTYPAPQALEQLGLIGIAGL